MESIKGTLLVDSDPRKVTGTGSCCPCPSCLPLVAVTRTLRFRDTHRLVARRGPYSAQYIRIPLKKKMMMKYIFCLLVGGTLKEVRIQLFMRKGPHKLNSACCSDHKLCPLCHGLGDCS